MPRGAISSSPTSSGAMGTVDGAAGPSGAMGIVGASGEAWAEPSSKLPARACETCAIPAARDPVAELSPADVAGCRRGDRRGACGGGEGGMLVARGDKGKGWRRGKVKGSGKRWSCTPLAACNAASGVQSCRTVLHFPAQRGTEICLPSNQICAFV